MCLNNLHFLCVLYNVVYVVMVSTVCLIRLLFPSFPLLYPEGIVSYMRKQAGPSARELSTMEDVKKFLGSTEHSVIGGLVSLSLSLSLSLSHSHSHSISFSLSLTLSLSLIYSLTRMRAYACLYTCTHMCTYMHTVSCKLQALQELYS